MSLDYPGTGAVRRPTYEHLPRTNCVQDFLYQSASDDRRMYSSWVFNSSWQRLAAVDLTYDTSGRLNSEQDERFWRYFLYNSARRLDFYSEYLNNGSGQYDLHSGNTTTWDAWSNVTGIERYADYSGTWEWRLVEGRTFSLRDRLLTRAMGPNGTPTHTLTYDARGRVTEDGEYHYTWNTSDRLTAVERLSDQVTWAFSYDAAGRLISMNEGGSDNVHFRWRGSTVREERVTTASGTLTRSFRADGMEQGGVHLALLRDARGSVVGLATGGERVRSYAYTVWGEQTVGAPSSAASAPYDTHLGFTGHVVHRPTGLVFAPARVYAPRLRQWLTRDPLGERDAVDGRNLYAYVAGDPVNFTDPTGEFIVPVIAGAFVVGFVAGYYRAPAIASPSAVRSMIAQYSGMSVAQACTDTGNLRENSESQEGSDSPLLVDVNHFYVQREVGRSWGRLGLVLVALDPLYSTLKSIFRHTGIARVSHGAASWLELHPFFGSGVLGFLFRLGGGAGRHLPSYGSWDSIRWGYRGMSAGINDHYREMGSRHRPVDMIF